MNTTKLLIYNTGSEGQGVVKMDNLELQRRLCWNPTPASNFFQPNVRLEKMGQNYFNQSDRIQLN